MIYYQVFDGNSTSGRLITTLSGTPATASDGPAATIVRVRFSFAKRDPQKKPTPWLHLLPRRVACLCVCVPGCLCAWVVVWLRVCACVHVGARVCVRTVLCSALHLSHYGMVRYDNKSVLTNMIYCMLVLLSASPCAEKHLGSMARVDVAAQGPYAMACRYPGRNPPGCSLQRLGR